MNIQNKVVLITGASEGIGAACAQGFAKRGAKLSLTARRENKLREAAPLDSLIAPGDITNPGDRQRIVGATLDRFGRIDILLITPAPDSTPPPGSP